jgi:hypothetical protein
VFFSTQISTKLKNAKWVYVQTSLTEFHTNWMLHVERYVPRQSLAVTAQTSPNPQLLKGTAWRSSVPNFTQEIWKLRSEIYSLFKVNYDSHLSDFHETHAWLSRWRCVTDGETHGRTAVAYRYGGLFYTFIEPVSQCCTGKCSLCSMQIWVAALCWQNVSFLMLNHLVHMVTARLEMSKFLTWA